MADRGITGEVAEDIYAKILAFSSYGFPESHAISFAYLVYASAWLKCYYPAAFTAALLRAQPMGFYSPGQPDQRRAQARRRGPRGRRQRQRRPRPPWRTAAQPARPPVPAATPAADGGSRCRASLRSGSACPTVRNLGDGRRRRDRGRPAVRGPRGLRPPHRPAGPGARGAGHGGRVRLLRDRAGGRRCGRPGRPRRSGAGQLPGTTVGLAAPPLTADDRRPRRPSPTCGRPGPTAPIRVAHIRERLAERGVIGAAALRDAPGRARRWWWPGWSRTGSSRERRAGWCS